MGGATVASVTVIEAPVYAEHAPPAWLAGDVQCLWTARISTEGTILPDGCLDIVVSAGGAFVAGPDTHAWTPTQPEGEWVHGVRFQTGRGSRVLGVPADALRDRRVDLADLWGRVGARISARLVERPDLLTDVVSGRLVRDDTSPVDGRLDLAVRSIRSGAGVARLARRLDLSERQLRRRFSAAVGYGPATYLRVARLQRFLGLAGRAAADLPAGERPSLAVLAADAGYADQPHLTRDSRDLAGTTPVRLLERVS